MGEIADDIINGFQCSWCGICFEGEHGYPVACWDCFEDALKEAKKKGWEVKKKDGVAVMINGVQRAINEEL